ncbi:MAG: RnfABCDGE type electron transport complex subunit D [Candidatus Omnitrophota bacterium]|nr:RnfABCDGE type electron transport complex subunit D [Candidatus Omnitrophota bacterium]
MEKLTITASPHISSDADVKYIMKEAVKALLPVVAASLYFFGMQAFGVITASLAGTVITEFVLQKARNRKVRINDHSAVITGLLLAMVLPPSLPLWMCFLGGVIAIGLGKEIFGGLGCNIFNPALLARAFLMAAFPVALTTWTNPRGVDAVTSATPLALEKFGHNITDWMPLFVGRVGGSIGETSALAILAGFGYMMYKKIIDYRIPTAFIMSAVVFSGAVHLIDPSHSAGPVFHVLAGGLLLGAVFMATDPVTSPVTKKGRWIFGAACGIIAMIIRNWGGLPEGVMYSILLMNAVTPLINMMTRPKRFGAGYAK